MRPLGDRRPSRVLAAALFVLAAMVLVGALVSPDRRASLIYAAPMIAGFATMTWCLYRPLGRRGIETVIVGLAAASVGLAALGLAQVAETSGWLLPAGSLSGPLDVNENVIAGMLVVLWPFGVGLSSLAVCSGRRWLAIAGWASSLVSVLAVALIPCRGAQAALCVAAACWLLVRHRPSARWVWLALGAGALFGATLFAFGSVRLALTSSALWMTARQRIEIWSRALDTIAAFPLTGVGPGNYYRWILHTQPLLLSKPSVTHAHNLYLQVAVDAGILGGIAYLTLHALVLRMAMGAMRAKRLMDQERLALETLKVSIIGMLTHGLVDAATWGNKVAFIPWIVVSAVVSLALCVNSENT